MNSFPYRLSILTALLMLIFGLSQCGSQQEKSKTELVYLNHHDSVGYVGINTCKQCHADIYESFLETGMGSSFHPALPQYSAGEFNGAVLHDSSLNLYYRPFWQNDSLWLEEFRLKGADTTYRKIQRIDYIVGSGQHTNSHMFLHKGYLHQAPFTWYAQEGKLDLPPGFEDGANSRFTRQIGLECTSCHNSMPVGFRMGSINKYAEVPGAIDCERCHGPGEVHVKRIKAGEVVDTASETDYSIVNVGKLTPELQFEVCQRCHLQGNPVLKPGKSFFDFKPGMFLNEVMDVYLPRYSNAGDDFIMASHADRFKQSACLVSDHEFNCTSCHNPHKSVRVTKLENYNKVCGGCHEPAPRHECTAPEKKLIAAGYNCVGCHMPLSGSTDIPHVSIHDHRIQIPGMKADNKEVRKFLELAAVNNPNPTSRSKALAYLQQFERFGANQLYLDSARYFLSKLENSEESMNLWVYYYYLGEDFNSLTNLINKRGTESSLSQLDSMSYDNMDAWTAYRIAEAYQGTGQPEQALDFMEQALKLMPYNPDILNKLGSLHLKLGNKEKAQEYFQKCLLEYSTHREALNNLGYIYLLRGEFSSAKRYFRKALEQDPDYELAWLNLAAACLQRDELREATNALEQALRVNPQNNRAAMMLLELKGNM